MSHIKNRKKVNEFLGYYYCDDGTGSLSNQVLMYRIEKGLTMSKLAECIGTSTITMERIENKEKCISIEMKKKISFSVSN